MGFKQWVNCKKINVGNGIAKSILLYLATCENEKTGQTNPSQSRISKELELCENSVRKGLKILENKGLIIRHTARQGKRVLGTNYSVNPEIDTSPRDASPREPSYRDTSPREPVIPHHVSPHEMHPNKKYKKENKKENKKAAAKTNLSPLEIIETYKSNDLYKGLDIDTEGKKARRWIENNPGRKFTRKFFTGWLNRTEGLAVEAARPMSQAERIAHGEFIPQQLPYPELVRGWFTDMTRKQFWEDYPTLRWEWLKEYDKYTVDEYERSMEFAKADDRTKPATDLLFVNEARRRFEESRFALPVSRRQEPIGASQSSG